jgi:polysaccharide biosynthesis transport protein
MQLWCAAASVLRSSSAHAAHPKRAEGFAMTLRQFLSVLRARWALALGMLVLALAVAAALALLLPKQYSATASLVIDVKSADPIAGVLSPALTMPSYMATQVDIIESERVALRVAQSLRMTEIREMRDQWQRDTGGAGKLDVWLANLLQRNLDVKPARESNVIHVSYKSADPAFSAIVANGIVKAYLDTMLELRVDPAKSFSSFFDQRSRELRDAVEKAQARLSAFQRQSGILVGDERIDVETLRLNELSAQLVGLQGASADSRSRQVAAAGSPDQMNDVIANPVVAGLRGDLARMESKLQETTERLGDRHPQVIEMSSNIAAMRGKLAEETQRLSGSARVTNGINQSREAQVRGSLDAQRAKLLRMKAQRDEMAVLQREVEHAQRGYDGVMSRLTQTSLESLTPQTNALLLMAATEPAKPSSPKLGFNLAIGAVVGVLLAIAAVFAREMADRRIRSLEDVSRDVGLPVLGSMLGHARRGPFARRHPIPMQVLRRPRMASAALPAAGS